MNRIVLGLCTVVGLLLLEPAGAAVALSDHQLAGTSHGSVEHSLAGQGLPQQPQQPNSDQDPSLPGPPGADAARRDAMELFPQTVAALQSAVQVDYERRLLLGGTVQRDLMALNLENQYASDVIAGSNIIDGRLRVSDMVIPVVVIHQSGGLEQSYRPRVRRYASAGDYHYERTVRTSTADDIIDDSRSSLIDQRDRREHYYGQASAWDVSVGRVSLSDLVEGDTTVYLIDPWSHQLIGSFDLDATVDLGWFGKYGGSASYSGLTLVGPTAAYHGLDLLGEDLLINAELALPALDFGDVTVEGCVAECIEGKVDLGSFGGTNLFEVMERIDNAVAPYDLIGFSEDGILLKGLGDMLEDELNINTGFAFTGSGHFRSENVAKVEIGGEASFGLETALTFTVDMRDIDELGLIKDFFNKNKALWEYARSDQLIDVTIPFTFVDQETAPFDITYAGVVLAQLGPGEVSADRLTYSAYDYTIEDHSRIEASVSTDVGESTFSESLERYVQVGGRLTDGQAELLALSEGDLDVLRSSEVTLSSGAQQNMKVLHGVNAVSSIAANNFNMSKIPALGQGVQRMSLQQHNQFVQQR